MKRLICIQAELKAPKNQKNNFGGYNYRSCEDIMEAVKPLLKKQGLALVVSDDITEIAGRFYIKATAKVIDENKDVIAATTAFAREEESKKGMDASQITGSASSYARKYALNGLFAIDDTKDADATNKHGKDAIDVPIISTEKLYNNEVKEHIDNIKMCSNRDDLELYWGSLPAKDKKNPDILKAFKEMGEKYPKGV